jgi:choline kinase
MTSHLGAQREPVAVLLAAGTGSRLGGRLKALFPIGGRALIDHCLETLVEAGIGRLLIVAGYAADSLEAHVRSVDSSMAIECVYNPRYLELNNFYTLRVACAAVEGPLMILNSDVIFRRKVVELVREAGGPLALAIEPGRVDPEALKAEVAGGRVRALGKDVDPIVAFGEFTGISLISDDVRRQYLSAADEALWRGETTLYYEDIYDRLCPMVDARVVEVAPGSWAEVDCPCDVPPAARVAASKAREAAVA